jgi:predicted nucleic acid-binding protein
MKYVADTSIAVKCVLPEADSAKAIQLFDDYARGTHDLVAPDLFPTEVANVLMMAERQGKLHPGEALQGFRNIMRAAPTFHAATPLLPRAIELALQFRQSAYDCLYVALAEREGCELVTADDKLVVAVSPSLPFVIRLADLP